MIPLLRPSYPSFRIPVCPNLETESSRTSNQSLVRVTEANKGHLTASHPPTVETVSAEAYSIDDVRRMQTDHNNDTVTDFLARLARE